jgi:TRAP-type C4-dicarboxylate transport system permease small subunit
MAIPRVLRDLDRNIGVAAFFVLTGLLFFQVVLRVVADTSIIGLDELERYLFIVMVYMAIAFTERVDGHIRFDSFLNALPQQINKAVRIAILTGSAFVFGVALYSAFISIARNTANMTPILEIPFFIFFLPTILGFLLITLTYLYKLAKLLKTTDKMQGEL